MIKSKRFSLLAGLSVAGMIAAACAPATVIQTQVVQVTVPPEVQEVVQTQVVEVTSAPEIVEVNTAFTTPHPILGDVRVRQAIAYCTNRPELIKSVYSWASEEVQANLLMDTNINSASWASYNGPEIQKYPFDLEKGKALLNEAGWTGDEGTRSNADGRPLFLRFTTTTAAFRVTWASVFEQQMAACGIQVVRNHVPASWWFGSDSGLRRRDFELGAYAWVGEADPKGQTLYACNQIPLPTNNWAGQNYMGWCNETASNAINAANNALDQAERIEQYKTFQIEFAKDMISLPVFQRAEGNAATLGLQNFKPSATDYYTWNSHEWALEDGGEELVVALSQEPASMYTLRESSAVQRTVGYLVFEGAVSQYNYNYQTDTQAEIPTLDNGGIVINTVDVAEGTEIIDASGVPTDPDGNLLTLAAGVSIQNDAGETVVYESGSVKMRQLVITYKFQENLTWSDGTPVSKADFELAYANDCNPESGAVDYSICQSIASVEFGDDNSYTVTWKPGYFAPLSFIAPIGFYPSHQVLSDGRKLADVPTTEWASLPEIADTPLGVGPYVLKEWNKGQSLVLEANPNYWGGELAIKKITILIIGDTKQAVAQLLTGDVDVIGSETLGAGEEVQTVLDNQDKLQVLIEPSATWEHIDFNLFIP